MYICSRYLYIYIHIYVFWLSEYLFLQKWKCNIVNTLFNKVKEWRYINYAVGIFSCAHTCL